MQKPILKKITNKRVGLIMPQDLFDRFSECVESGTGKSRGKVSEVIRQLVESFVYECEVEQAAQAEAAESEAE